jgi:hypothetical protein
LAFLGGLEVLGEVVLLLISQSEAADAIIVVDDVGERPGAPIVEVRWMLL